MQAKIYYSNNMELTSQDLMAIEEKNFYAWLKANNFTEDCQLVIHPVELEIFLL